MFTEAAKIDQASGKTGSLCEFAKTCYKRSELCELESEVINCSSRAMCLRCKPVESTHVPEIVARPSRPASVPDGFHWCPRCGRVLPLDAKHFKRNRSHKSGFDDYCKTCRNEYWTRYRKAREKRVREVIVDA